MQSNQQKHERQEQDKEQKQEQEHVGEQNTAVTATQSEEQPDVEQRKAEEYLDLLQRTQADFINYRRRSSQEQREGRITAQSALLAQLLPVLDDLGRALDAAPQDLATHPWVRGLFLVARRLDALLEQLGVKRTGAPGEHFDPHRHEAIATVAQADVPEGTILQVAQPGYILDERVIRPAQVIVAGNPDSAQETSAL